MAVTTRDLASFNSLTVGEQRFFTLKINGTTLVVPRECAHRGGPLDLGLIDQCERTVKCPWHGSTFKLSHFEKRALPTVRNGNMITIVSETVPTLFWTEYLPHLDAENRTSNAPSSNAPRAGDQS